MEKVEDLKENSLKPPKVGEIVKGKIIGRGKSKIFLDLGPIGSGIIYGREFYDAKGILKDCKVGDDIFSKIIDLENEEGYLELSLNQAGKELAWDTLRSKESKK